METVKPRCARPAESASLSRRCSPGSQALATRTRLLPWKQQGCHHGVVRCRQSKCGRLAILLRKQLREWRRGVLDPFAGSLPTRVAKPVTSVGRTHRCPLCPHIHVLLRSWDPCRQRASPGARRLTSVCMRWPSPPPQRSLGFVAQRLRELSYGP